jgi:hypothetical protein
LQDVNTFLPTPTNWDSVPAQVTSRGSSNTTVATAPLSVAVSAGSLRSIDDATGGRVIILDVKVHVNGILAAGPWRLYATQSEQ